MKMIPGSGSALSYGQYSHIGKYKVPVPALSAVQLYIDIGAGAPGSATYELINTATQTVESVTPLNYVIGQDENDLYYGVFAGFAGSSATQFVIAITLGGQIYFSEEYSTSDCNILTLIQGCYGNLEPALSHDCNGQYFGLSQGGTMGDGTLTYKHQLYLRGVEVTKFAIRNNFQQGLTRTFRTKKEKIYQFWAEIIPEWYLDAVDAVFTRGEVYVGGIKYLVNETNYVRLDECAGWQLNGVTLKENCEVNFSCEENPCLPPVVESGEEQEICCDPTSVSATVEIVIET